MNCKKKVKSNLLHSYTDTLDGTPFNDRNTGLYQDFLFLGAEHLLTLVRTTLYCLKSHDMNSASKVNTLGYED